VQFRGSNSPTPDHNNHSEHKRQTANSLTQHTGSAQPKRTTASLLASPYSSIPFPLSSSGSRHLPLSSSPSSCLVVWPQQSLCVIHFYSIPSKTKSLLIMATSTENASPIGIANVSHVTFGSSFRKLYERLLTHLITLAPQPAVCQFTSLMIVRTITDGKYTAIKLSQSGELLSRLWCVFIWCGIYNWEETFTNSNIGCRRVRFGKDYIYQHTFLDYDQKLRRPQEATRQTDR
jgi:hypothetical protein